MSLALRRLLPPRRIRAFGEAPDAIASIVVVNLDRQPARWRRILADLSRFRSAEGHSLASLATRMPAVDARDHRQTAPTADVDPLYDMAGQLFVEPDPRLEACFPGNEVIRMTRQEIAVARSHVEAWKRIAAGGHRHVLVLEDDVYFVAGAAGSIERGWCEALASRPAGEAPELFYLSYLDAGGSAGRADVGIDVFRPERGLWHLSGYVLSRAGACRLLRSMPVVGPVDLWMNRRFADLDVVALMKPAILQRPDGGSDNAYSIVPYLSRAGVVDAVRPVARPASIANCPVFAWNAPGGMDRLGMALSMLGHRVRSGRRGIPASELRTLLGGGEPIFDAYVDADVHDDDLRALAQARPDVRFVIGTDPVDGRPASPGIGPDRTPRQPIARTLYLGSGTSWLDLCGFLGRSVPDLPYPVGCEGACGLFHADELKASPHLARPGAGRAFDASPWVLPPTLPWGPKGDRGPAGPRRGATILAADLTHPSKGLRTLSDTFPGNLAVFAGGGVAHGADGIDLILDEHPGVVRRYRSGALATVDAYRYGCFEVEMKAAAGPGVVTGFFLHRDRPRQEIDIEILGNDPRRMLVNVYFNPGDDGADMAFGYRGTPVSLDLGFDATEAFHSYAIEWCGAGIRWLVDGKVVHRRVSWDPTPIPHLPMRLHLNLWASNASGFAGRLRPQALPVRSGFKNLIVAGMTSPGAASPPDRRTLESIPGFVG